MKLKEKNKILHDTLISEKCQQPADAVQKRELLATTEEGVLFELEEKLQKKLISELISCRKDRQSTTVSSLQSATTAQATQSALVHCEEAINLVEPWRADTNGTRLNYKVPNCDTKAMIKAGYPWFRFSKGAGNRLLDSCPPPYSCGTHIGLWTDEPMPETVGVETATTVYGSWTGGCKQISLAIHVIRCSHLPNDFVYKYASSSRSFCGM